MFFPKQAEGGEAAGVGRYIQGSGGEGFGAASGVGTVVSGSVHW